MSDSERAEWIIQRCTQQWVGAELQYQDWGPYGPGTMTPLTKSDMLAALEAFQRRWPDEEFRGHNVANCNCHATRGPGGQMNRQLPAELALDAGWRGAWAIITSSTFRQSDMRLWAHVDLVRHNLFFDRILEYTTWSSTERFMLEAAWSMFNQDCRVTLYDLLNRLDDDQLQTIIGAVLIWRGSADFAQRDSSRSVGV
jgi:hypothetical protein